MLSASSPAAVEDLLRARGHRVRRCDPLPGDVGRRRYFRVRLGAPEAERSAVTAVYPPDLAAVCRRFLVTGRLLDGAGVPVPRVLDTACDEGWMLVEDLGETTLFDRFAGRPEAWAELSPYYRFAAGLIRRIAALPAETVAGLNPPLDGDLLRRELRQTWEAFWAPRGLAPERGLGLDLHRALEAVCGALAAAAPVPCHRDFMVRNLMPLRRSAGGEEPLPGALAVLDHQDLRLGPPFYDLASLLNDSLFPPSELEEELLAGSSAEERFLYRRAAVQRTLKAVGTFALHGGPRHRALIQPTLECALRHLEALPEGSSLAPALRRASAGGDLLD